MKEINPQKARIYLDICSQSFKASLPMMPPDMLPLFDRDMALIHVGISIMVAEEATGNSGEIVAALYRLLSSSETEKERVVEEMLTAAQQEIKNRENEHEQA